MAANFLLRGDLVIEDLLKSKEDSNTIEISSFDFGNHCLVLQIKGKKFDSDYKFAGKTMWSENGIIDYDMIC
jgi:hypothetical protein